MTSLDCSRPSATSPTTRRPAAGRRAATRDPPEDETMIRSWLDWCAVYGLEPL